MKFQVERAFQTLRQLLQPALSPWPNFPLVADSSSYLIGNFSRMASSVPFSAARSAWASPATDLTLGLSSSSQQTAQRRRSHDIVASARAPPPPPVGRRPWVAGSRHLTASRGRPAHHHQGSHRRRNFATAAADVARVQSSAASVEVGVLVEFKRPTEHILGLVMSAGGSNIWKVEDARCVLLSTYQGA